MEFWNVFAQESLQKPWLIGPEASTIILEEPVQDKVFVIEPGTTDELYAMVGKMIGALKFQPSDVGIIEVPLAQLGALSEWSEGKQLLFFGDGYPGGFGDFVHLHGSVAMRTHDLKSLQNDPNLKKITWAHLKKYAGGTR